MGIRRHAHWSEIQWPRCMVDPVVAGEMVHGGDGYRRLWTRWGLGCHHAENREKTPPSLDLTPGTFHAVLGESGAFGGR